MSFKSVAQRRMKMESVPPADGGGTPKDDRKKVNGLADRFTASSRFSTNSCPPIQPKAAMRKNSPFTGSSNGLNVKPSANSKGFNGLAITNAKKSVGLLKIVAKNNLKDSNTKYFGSDEVENGLEQMEEQVNGCYNGIEDILNGAIASVDEDYLEHNRSPVSPNDDDVGEYKNQKSSEQGQPSTSNGILTKFFSKESTKRVNSAPAGLGICQGNLLQNSVSEKTASSIVDNTAICNPNCSGLHFCLQRIGTLCPIATISQQNHVKTDGQLGMDKNGGEEEMYNNGHGVIPTSKTDISFQDAFSCLLTIRNVASESGICSLDDYKNIADIETLLLKVFSHTGSKHRTTASKNIPEHWG